MERNKLLSADYLDILFDGRNKKYGGYELRKTYASRTRRATSAVILGAAILAAIPVIASRIAPDRERITIVHAGPTIIAPPPADHPKPPVVQPREVPKIAGTFKAPVLKVVPDNEQVDPPKSTEDNSDKVPGLDDTPGSPDGVDPGLKGASGDGDALIEAPAKPKDIPATIVEQMPHFNGDLAAYLQSHLQYPDAARDDGKEGRVGIRFVVNEDGTISDVEVTHSAMPLLDREAVRVVSGMPRWKPGKQGGIPVKVYFTLPITFQLD